MDSEFLKNEWKDKLVEFKDENKFNIYELLKQINSLIFEFYDKEKNYSIKRKLIKNTWHCDSIKEYILFLEEKLSSSIERLKLYEDGFDERNKLFSLKKNI